jgi:hypothetical protein
MTPHKLVFLQHRHNKSGSRTTDIRQISDLLNAAKINRFFPDICYMKGLLRLCNPAQGAVRRWLDNWFSAN